MEADTRARRLCRPSRAAGPQTRFILEGKMALNLMERLAQATRMTEAAQQGRKRTWSTASSGNSSGGSSGRQPPRSASWKDMRNFGWFSSGGGHISGGPRGGGGGGYQYDPSYNISSYSGYSGGSRHATGYYPDHGKFGYPARDGYQPGGHRAARAAKEAAVRKAEAHIATAHSHVYLICVILMVFFLFFLIWPLPLNCHLRRARQLQSIYIKFLF